MTGTEQSLAAKHGWHEWGGNYPSSFELDDANVGLKTLMSSEDGSRSHQAQGI